MLVGSGELRRVGKEEVGSMDVERWEVELAPDMVELEDMVAFATELELASEVGCAAVISITIVKIPPAVVV